MKENTKHIYAVCRNAFGKVYNNKFSEKSKEAQQQSKEAHITNLQNLKAETQAGKKRIKETIKQIQRR